MVNKCAAYGCKSGYASNPEKLSAFAFPFDKPELLRQWIRFVNDPNFYPTNNNVMCVKHFEPQFLIFGKCRNKLNWQLNPVPTIPSEIALAEKASCLPTVETTRKPPLHRPYAEDEMDTFISRDQIAHFDQLTAGTCPPGYTFRKTGDHVLYYRLDFEIYFPRVLGAIKVDKDLHRTSRMGC
uniref:THAP domain-containing protein 1-like n=1 Tax=Ciona intestinalis TaxID=7719 RepID=UPI000521B6D9|nr:THAP domain-containing protein 1-like [Ciona intestinalis]|eukprot:XP_009861104.1 THAP domain-containing protein 1-like [Ciona intestinalis]